MDYKFLNALEASPVITAVKDDEGVDACLKVKAGLYLFCMEIYVTILNCSKVKKAGKLAVVHLDLIHGLASKNIAADLSENIQRQMVLFLQNQQLYIGQGN